MAREMVLLEYRCVIHTFKITQFAFLLHKNTVMLAVQIYILMQLYYIFYTMNYLQVRNREILFTVF